MTWAEGTQCVGDRAQGPMAVPTVRTDGISECKETFTEEETEAQREAGGAGFWGWFLFACFPQASPGSSWEPRGPTAHSEPSAVPTHPPELYLPLPLA